MKRIYHLFAILGILALVAMVQPANKSISGKVISFEESFPLKGVVVQVKGSPLATQTLGNGTFTLDVPADARVLVFTAGGYQTKEIPITKESSYTVVLEKAGSPSR